jgi:mitogen-activated protein kinase kinase kinase
MDKEVLKEMGIDKVGDRVRLFLGIKKLRTKAYANQKKRNRVSLFPSISVTARPDF